MKKFSMLLVGLILAVMMIVPVMADTTSQNAGGVIVGNDNKQIVENYNNQNDQSAGANIKGGHDNTAIAQNANGDIVNGNVVNGATAVNNQQIVSLAFESNPSHYALDTPIVDTQITSLYSGEVLVIPNDGSAETPRIQKHGEKYQYTVKSALPVLVYVINSNDDDKVLSLSGAPVYDTVRKKFEHSNVFVYADSKFRSTQQSLEFTVKENGRYSFVIDTRVSQNLNGELSQISANSVDVVYSVEKIGNETPLNEFRQNYGKTEIYKTLSNGQIDNTQNVIIRSF